MHSKKFIEAFSEKKLLILGMGKTGMSVFLNMKTICASTMCFDDNEEKLSYFASEYGKKYVLDKFDSVSFLIEYFDYVVVSPGVSPNHSIYKAAFKAKILLSDIDILYLKYPDAKYIAVTGTDGKSTTVSLIGSVIKNNQLSYAIGGNIGIPALDLPKSECYVLELSSFQLDIIGRSSLDKIQFDIAILLNIRPSHLDRYITLQAYSAAKQQIFNFLKPAGQAVVCIEDDQDLSIPIVRNLIEKASCNLSLVYKKDSLCNHAWHNLCHVYNIMQNSLYKYSCEKNKQVFVTSFSHLDFLGCATDMCCSVGLIVSSLLSLNITLTLDAINQFKALNHRLEVVRTLRHVKFVNDSKATNVYACFNAINSMKNIYWLAGGKKNKEDDFNILLQSSCNIKQAYFFGQASSYLYNFFKDSIKSYKFDTMAAAFDYVFQDVCSINNNNCVVLLSPACQSFDQFTNFEHRGNEFISLVMQHTKQLKGCKNTL